MEQSSMIEWIIYSCMILSLVLSAAAIVYISYIFIKRKCKVRKMVKAKKAGLSAAIDPQTPLIKKMPFVVLMLLGSVWAARFAVGYYLNFHQIDDLGLSAVGRRSEILNSFIHALQTFSLDENYSEYITAARCMMRDTLGIPWITRLTGIFIAVLNVAAPISGGAVLLDFFTEALPRLRFRLARILFKREAIYFSKLNQESLALAKDIVSERSGSFFRHYTMVFADAYSKNDDESSSETIHAAKALGAICLKDDILSISLKRFAQNRIYIIDHNENSNLAALTRFLYKDAKYAKRTEVYIFSSDKKISHLDEEVSYIVKNRKRELADEIQRKCKVTKPQAVLLKAAAKSIPAVIPVATVRNMTYNLFMDVPLFEPLIDKQKEADGKRKLTLTILGSGVIGTEFFLTAYWCGQMLDTSIKINVVSKEAEAGSSGSAKEAFESRINQINSDIFKSRVFESPLLRYSTDDDPPEYSPPYFDYAFYEVDVLNDRFLTDDATRSLLDSDYFIVVLGSDEDNFFVADMLRRRVGAHHMYNKINAKTVISYAIYNTDLSRSFNLVKLHNYALSGSTDNPDILMHAFGSREEVYSIKNVMFNGVYDGTGTAFDKTENASRRSTAQNSFDDIYTYRARLARRVHRRYKEFSCGMYSESLFMCRTAESVKEHFKNAHDKYLKYLFSEGEYSQGESSEPPSVHKKGPARSTDDSSLRLFHRLAWLEHRRWVAFMRINGFRSVKSKKSFNAYINSETAEHTKGDHKHVGLKLHPCLVECADTGMKASYDDYGAIITGHRKKMVQSEDRRDLLDELSINIVERKDANKREPFKYWDYPRNDSFSQNDLLFIAGFAGYTDYKAAADFISKRRKKNRDPEADSVFPCCINGVYYYEHSENEGEEPLEGEEPPVGKEVTLNIGGVKLFRVPERKRSNLIVPCDQK